MNKHSKTLATNDNYWKEYDAEFADIVSPLQVDLESGKSNASEVASELNTLLTSFLASKPNLLREVKTFFRHKPSALTNLKDARKLKNELEKKSRQKNATVEDKVVASEALKHYNFILKQNKGKEDADEIKEQERQYKRNFHKYAKDVTKGIYGKTKIAPTFTKSTADQTYTEKYSHDLPVDITKLEWFPNVIEPEVPYDLSPYTAEDILKALKTKNQTSAPGDDQILYAYLTNLPSIHPLLATMFTAIRDSGEAPKAWGLSNIILIPKGDDIDQNNPADFRMIALTSNVAKLYHTLESSRTINFMITNRYLDPSAQKAFINGINGCVEHVQVIQEVIQHAKSNQKTAHITWFDLMDAFGSLSHMLILHVLQHYHLPRTIIKYIEDFYKTLKGKVKTKEWETEIFEFLRGTFQGDPFSGTIFLITLNPLIEYIKRFKERQGYTIKETTVITTPFADDFNLISNNHKLHQKLITAVVEKAETMGLSFKPSKCRSLSICGGSPTNVNFVLKSSEETNQEVYITTVHDNPHKFLGATVTYTNTPKEYYDQFHKILSEKLNNIDKSRVRGEHKLAIYERYALPSMRYHLSIHDMHKTHLDGLDKVARTFVKKWLNFPTRGVTDVGIFHPYLLNVKQPSHLYHEGHASNMLLMRLRRDATVNACIESKIERERQWKKKSSTAISSFNIVAPIVESMHTTQRSTSRQTISIAKRQVAKSVNEEVKDNWKNKLEKLTMQGDFAKLLVEEKQSVTWQSIARKVPRNVMAFAARLSTNSLASPDNLKRWGKRKMGTCPLCSSPNGTLAHITNMCTTALNQGRFSWRHDSVLLHITTVVKSLATSGTEVFSDLPSFQVNGTTIPADIMVSAGAGSKPDIVIVNREQKTIALLELTCSLSGSANKAHQLKRNKYTQLAIDLEVLGYMVFLVPFEVISSGHITNVCKTNIRNTLQQFNIRIKNSLFVNLAKIALLCTMSIFHAYNEKDWTSPPLLAP